MTDTADVPVLFNPFEPGFFDDPYAQYRKVRAADPVHHTPLDVWMLFRYEDCFTLLRDPSTSVEMAKAWEINPEARQERMEQMRALLPEMDEQPRQNRSILNVDPPDHTRLRKLLSKVFTPRRIEDLRPKVRQVVDEHLDAVAERGEMDVIADLAFPLPFTVISEMLGMPDADRDQLRAWSHTGVRLLDPILSPDQIRESLQAMQQMFEHCAEVIAWKRANPADDLLTALIGAEEDGERLSPEELQDQVVLLFIAGHETTVNLIGNGTRALLAHPDQQARLREDPTLDAAAVDELLRFDSPVQFSRRIVLRDVEIGGQAIQAGTFVMTCLGAANHDPEQFGPDADALDLGREGAGRHLSFGSGIHHCLGAALARLEGQEAIGRLVRRFPDLAPTSSTAAWNGRIVLRGLDELPVRFTPTGPTAPA